MSATLEQGESREAPPSAGNGTRRTHLILRYKVSALAGLAVLVAVVAFVLVGNRTNPSTPPAKFPATTPSSIPVGSVAPSFTLPRIGGGTPVSLSTAHGEPVMVNFFASWCTDCRQELRALAAVARKEEGTVATIGIDTNDPSTSTSERLLEKAGASYPVGVDSKARVASKYDLRGIPVTFFIGKSGRVLAVAFGPQTEHSLLERLHKLSARGAAE